MNRIKDKSFENKLVNDLDIAGLLSISRSWVRKERFSRRHGKPHVFDVDPVLIGTSPRYRMVDVLAWIERRSVQSKGRVRS